MTGPSAPAAGSDGPAPRIESRSVGRLGVPQVVFLGLLLLVPIALALTLARPSGVCACSPTAPSLQSPIEGIVRSVDSAGLGDVRRFVLLTDGGDSIDFTLGQLDDPTAFPPAHLAEHQASSAPIRVYFRVDDSGENVVYHLEDALPASPSSQPASPS